MRMSVLPKPGLPVARIVAAALLASVATGCSSDATRFSALFPSEDSLTTSSIGRRNITGLNGAAPTPSADVSASAASAAQQQDYTTRQAALNQPFPASPSSSAYDPISTSTAGTSPARMAAQPSAVQRSALAAPTMASNDMSAERKQALAQPFPAAPAAASAQAVVKPDPMTTGTSAAKTAAAPAILPAGAPVPTPKQAPEQKVAVLPTATTQRDKSQASSDPAKLAAAGGAPQGGAAGTYVVKPGDSLSKIAKATGTPIDALKAANGLTTANIRIGQTLKIPSAGAVEPEAVKTASIPAKSVDNGKPAPQAYKPPAAPTVTDVASAVPKEAAPEATGIGKYRWPARGAVIAGYGENVGGKRNDGIDISVPAGTSVKAAENGVVIYAGNGLKELGNTVLVRHDDGTVTVYGHADSLSVTRGQKVQRGQQLATSGMSGNVSRPMLHFEVRKDATPVDPMTFLE